MGLSSTQERVLAITPKCTASLSMPLSLFLIWEVFCDHKSIRGSNAIQRALLGMSTIDVLSSSGWFLSTWAVPKGTFALSAGNRASCNYQGFLLQLAIGAPLYNCSLALFYLLMIKYNWTDTMLRGIEVWVHVGILSFSVGTAILLLPLKQYNHIGAVCWVIGDPADCGRSSSQSSDIPCERGNFAWIYGLTLFYGPLWLCVILCTYSMTLVYQKVRKTMRRGHRHSLTRRADNSRRSETEVVAQQAILYTLSFLITWMPSTIWSVAHWFQFSAFWLDFLAGLAEPLQGFWNILIFARNRPSTRAKLRKGLSVLTFGLFKQESTTETERFSTGQSLRATIGRNSGRSSRLSFLSALESQVGRSFKSTTAFGGDSSSHDHPWGLGDYSGHPSHEFSNEFQCGASDGTKGASDETNKDHTCGSGLEPMAEESDESPQSPLRYPPDEPDEDSAASTINLTEEESMKSPPGLRPDELPVYDTESLNDESNGKLPPDELPVHDIESLNDESNGKLAPDELLVYDTESQDVEPNDEPTTTDQGNFIFVANTQAPQAMGSAQEPEHEIVFETAPASEVATENPEIFRIQEAPQLANEEPFTMETAFPVVSNGSGSKQEPVLVETDKARAQRPPEIFEEIADPDKTQPDGSTFIAGSSSSSSVSDR